MPNPTRALTLPTNSGKSSLVKLLTRIYDPTGGAILLDGTPLPAYRQRAFRRATAVLAQGHHLFPLSMGENIGLGHAARAYDVPAVRAAAAEVRPPVVAVAAVVRAAGSPAESTGTQRLTRSRTRTRLPLQLRSPTTPRPSRTSLLSLATLLRST